MSAIRWAPFLMMAVADVFPGGCCGGARYHGPPSPPSLSVANRSTVDICTIEWLAGEGSQPQQLLIRPGSNTPDPPLKPPTSRQWPLPADKFTLRLVDCQGKELMKKDIDAHGQSVFIDYP